MRFLWALALLAACGDDLLPAATPSPSPLPLAQVAGCPSVSSSTLPGVHIRFSDDTPCRLSLEQALAGVELGYDVVVDADTSLEVSNDACGLIDTSGLIVRAELIGEDEYASTGSCPGGPGRRAVVLRQGTYHGTWSWRGRSIEPSDTTSGPPTPPFDIGPATLSLTAQGLAHRIEARMEIVVTAPDPFVHDPLPRAGAAWTQTYGMQPSGAWYILQYGPAVARSPDGGVVAAAFVRTNAGMPSYWVGKLDADGKLLWWHGFHDSVAGDTRPSIAVDPAGNVYVGGLSLYVRKYSPAGQLIGLRFVYPTSAAAMATDGDGNLFLAGDQGEVQKLDPAGDPLWTIPATTAPAASGLVVDATGGVTVVGALLGTRRYDGDGNLLWTRPEPVQAIAGNALLEAGEVVFIDEHGQELRRVTAPPGTLALALDDTGALVFAGDGWVAKTGGWTQQLGRSSASYSGYQTRPAIAVDRDGSVLAVLDVSGAPFIARLLP